MGQSGTVSSCSESEIHGLPTPLPGNFGRVKIEANEGADLLWRERRRVCFSDP